MVATVAYQATQPRSCWVEEQHRFFESIKTLGAFLASDAPLHAPVEQLLQGPVAVALAHVGQLAILRRLSRSPTRRENF